MKISVLLPYKENFASNYAGAVSLFVKDTIRHSKFYDTSVFGRHAFIKMFLRNYINIDLKKTFISSNSKNYVNQFLTKEKKLIRT